MKAAVALFLALAAGFVALAVYGKVQRIKTEFREEQARERTGQAPDLRADADDAGNGAVS